MGRSFLLVENSHRLHLGTRVLDCLGDRHRHWDLAVAVAVVWVGYRIHEMIVRAWKDLDHQVRGSLGFLPGCADQAEIADRKEIVWMGASAGPSRVHLRGVCCSLVPVPVSRVWESGLESSWPALVHWHSMSFRGRRRRVGHRLCLAAPSLWNRSELLRATNRD